MPHPVVLLMQTRHSRVLKQHQQQVMSGLLCHRTNIKKGLKKATCCNKCRWSVIWRSGWKSQEHDMTVPCCQRYSQGPRETAAIRATWDENRMCCDSDGSNAGADAKADRLKSLLFPDRRQQSRLQQLKVCQRDIFPLQKTPVFSRVTPVRVTKLLWSTW